MTVVGLVVGIIVVIDAINTLDGSAIASTSGGERSRTGWIGLSEKLQSRFAKG